MKSELSKRKDVERLCDAFVSCKNRADVYAFMRDVMTEKEVVEFANRLTAAVMLSENKSYDDVARVTSMSTTTIARVSKWLQEGMGGYTKVIAALHHHTPRKSVRSGVSS